jgi:hypothetical protein
MLSDPETLLPAIPLRIFLLTRQLLCFYDESCLIKTRSLALDCPVLRPVSRLFFKG